MPSHVDRASDEASQYRALLAVFRATMNGPRRMPAIPGREGQGMKGWGGAAWHTLGFLAGGEICKLR